MMGKPTKKTTFTFNHADQVDDYGTQVGNGATVKANFDSRAAELLTYINAWTDLLQQTTDGDSGADAIGATAIEGVTGATVQALLEGINARVSDMVLGEIPDGTITEAKLVSALTDRLKTIELMGNVVTALTYTEGLLTQADESVDGVLRRRTALTYDGTLLDTVTTTYYAADGTTALRTWVDTFTYTDGVMTTETRAVSV